MGSNDIPCRVTKELDRHLRAQELAERFPESFDEWELDHVRAVVPYDLARPVQALLCMRGSMTEGDYLKAELDALYNACVERWRNL